MFNYMRPNAVFNPNFPEAFFERAHFVKERRQSPNPPNLRKYSLDLRPEIRIISSRQMFNPGRAFRVSRAGFRKERSWQARQNTDAARH
jgi:hypothetical protein